MMQRLALVCSALMTIASVEASAQAKKPASAKPATTAPSPPAAAAPTVPPVAAPAAAPAPIAKAVVPAKRRHTRANEDARACLDLPNNVSIVKCAEKFL